MGALRKEVMVLALSLSSACCTVFFKFFTMH